MDYNYEFMGVEANVKIVSVRQELDDSGLPSGEAERSVSRYDGFFKQSQIDGTFSVGYAELNSDDGEQLTLIRIKPDKVTVRKRGEVAATMVFEVGVPHRSVYKVSSYEFDMEITAKSITRNMTKQGGELHMQYEMLLGGSRQTIDFTVTVKALE